ncbi:hypothetical protein Scep_028863 [Stephania cephalantha]|uniref:GDSL esterase/lipase n=1 Tax=Stephania cephalantha TaxID=152367 RepID=A0AAP0EAQ7_9MAGN
MAQQTPTLLLFSLQLTIFLTIIHTGESSAKVPAVIVFGDSTVDAGNNNGISTMLKSNFMPYGRDFEGGKPTGRFSNGRVPGDFISEAFGCKPAVPAYLDASFTIKDFATGVVFASAGTGYDNATSDVLSVIPLWKELDYFKDYQTKLRAYLGPQKADETLTEALYLVSVGTNDFLENYFLNPRSSSRFGTIAQYEDHLVGLADKFVSELHGLGARKISLGGIPPMGCLPLERNRNGLRGGACVEEYNNVAKEFNGKLAGLVVRLNNRLPGIKVVFSNPYDELLNIIQNPSQFGFENVAVSCCASGMFEMGYMCNRFNPFTCTDANKYVFWDSFHPTERTNALLSEYVVKDCLAQFL